ncbi:MAG: hypothetical protein SGJ05_12620 [bacterium]|nr:hypothetical protein [bacterium]
MVRPAGLEPATGKPHGCWKVKIGKGTSDGTDLKKGLFYSIVYFDNAQCKHTGIEIAALNV